MAESDQVPPSAQPDEPSGTTAADDYPHFTGTRPAEDEDPVPHFTGSQAAGR